MVDVSAIFAALAAFLAFRYGLAPKRKNAALLDTLTNKTDGLLSIMQGLYGYGVDGVLAWIDRRAKDEYLSCAQDSQNESPWSSGLFDFTLLIAAVYPLVFLLFGWALDGGSPPGLEAFIFAEPNGVKRAVVVSGLCLFLFLMGKGLHTKVRRALMYIVGAGASSGAVAGTLFVAITFAFALARAGAVVVSFTVGGVFSFAVFGSVIFSVASAFGIAFGVALLSFQSEKNAVKGLFYIGHTFILFSGMLAVVAFLDLAEPSRRIGLLIVVLGVLPLVNAPLDWLSWGATRGLLKFGRAKKTPLWALAIIGADVVFALLTLAVLTVVTVAVISFINVIGPSPVLPLGPVFNGLHERPGDLQNLWIYLMLFSTLVPAAVHVMVGLAALILALSKRICDSGIHANKTEMNVSRVRLWYPVLAAAGVMIFVTLSGLLWDNVVQFRVPFEGGGTALIAVAEGVDGWVQGMFSG